MELTLNELLTGKSTIIKNKQFLSTKAYVEPFIDRMSAYTNDFRIQVKTPDQITTTGGNRDLTFNRVLIQAVLPASYDIDEHKEVIGMLYGLDVKKPHVSFYKGMINSACTNLTVFNPNWKINQDIIEEEPINYSTVKQLLELTNDSNIMINKLKKTMISRENQILNLGKWCDNTLRFSINNGYGKVKLAISTPIEAYKQLFIDTDSPYYYPEGLDVSLFDVYNSFTQVITDDSKDILQKFNKTLLVGNILEII